LFLIRYSSLKATNYEIDFELLKGNLEKTSCYEWIRNDLSTFSGASIRLKSKMQKFFMPDMGYNSNLLCWQNYPKPLAFNEI